MVRLILGCDPLSSGLRPPHDDGASQKRPLDLITVAPDLLAPASQDGILVTYRVQIAANVPNFPPPYDRETLERLANEVRPQLQRQLEALPTS